MRYYIRQFLIAGILAVCVGLFFLGGGTLPSLSLLNSSIPKEEWIWLLMVLFRIPSALDKENIKGLILQGN